ncbi:DUF1799 domain-containing protein [Pseudoalteromonas maricaloris]|uniref:DUF1799 domain-containing protein n=1 Tax=Pseudoalteromonas maricaloris TaxID=184924 RepID=UPI0021AE17C2|nr:DUF1799 domain-containing protein [Pseudoalteromonas flavipulchra]
MRKRTISRTGKKLVDVARWYVGDLATNNSTLDDDEAHFGAPSKTKPQADSLYVLPENWTAVLALSTAGTQWQLCKQGMELALDYARAEVAWRYADITLTPTDFSKLQQLERLIVGLIRRPDEKPTEPSVTLKV